MAADSSSPATLSPKALRSVLDQLALAIMVIRGRRLIYANSRATALITRLRTTYKIELLVMLIDHLAQSGERPQQSASTISWTGHDNEPFMVHVMELDGPHGDVAVSIREIGTDISAFKSRYGLSKREIQVVELVLRGCSNSRIASMLGITASTAKKHLSRIFEKVGVDSRSQLTSKLV